jgi:ABC-type dipeptide/oligopeptide/nickel transport system permease subunit
LTDLLAHTAAPAEFVPEAPPSDAQGLTAKSLSPRQMAVKRFLGHKPAVICLVIMVIMILWVVFAPITARYGINQQIYTAQEGKGNARYLAPNADAWFGTDEIGRDLYSRLIYGTRVSLAIGIGAAVIAVVLGVVVGAFAGIRGGFFDDILMRVTDIFLAFPFLVALLVMRNMLGEISWLEPVVGDKSSIRFIIFLLAVFGWMPVARVVRGQVLALKEREFIEASRAVGASHFRIVTRHLLPNAIGPILVALTFTIVLAVIAEATLGFFGFGPQPGAGQTSLGNLVGSSKENVLTGNWWMVLFPCLVLLTLALTVNMVGDGLRDATDPKLQRGGGRA